MQMVINAPARPLDQDRPDQTHAARKDYRFAGGEYVFRPFSVSASFVAAEKQDWAPARLEGLQKAES
jgi:hypothetical protein